MRYIPNIKSKPPEFIYRKRFAYLPTKVQGIYLWLESYYSAYEYLGRNSGYIRIKRLLPENFIK